MVRRPASGPRRQSKHDIRGSKCLDICNYRTHRIFYYVGHHLQATHGDKNFKANIIAITQISPGVANARLCLPPELR